MIKLADLVLQLYSMVLLARVVISFIKIDPKHPSVKLLSKITDPALDPIRKFIPPAGRFDFSVIIVFLIIQCLRAILQLWNFSNSYLQVIILKTTTRASKFEFLVFFWFLIFFVFHSFVLHGWLIDEFDSKKLKHEILNR